MNIFDVLKQKHTRQLTQNLDIPDKKQLNTVVSVRIIKKIRRMAADFAVPRYAVTEHLLQTGHFYVNQILKNRKKKEIIRRHLIERHMLNTGYDDLEEILRIGEERYASEMIALSKIVIRDFRILQRVWKDAGKTGRFDDVEKARKKVVNSALKLADWISSHPLEEVESDNNEEDQ